MRRDAQRLEDVIEAIEQIQKYTVQGRQVFDNDELIQVWCVHHIQIIGEAMANISDEVRSSYPELEWSQIIAMRNILVHAYFGVDHDTVWNVVENHLPDLKNNAQTMLKSLSADNDNVS
jgi:uncharacterized protein with HEPN domain